MNFYCYLDKLDKSFKTKEVSPEMEIVAVCSLIKWGIVSIISYRITVLF